ncbi:hypothetical protein TNCV_4720281 [Trichonephila clavipes]|uniref:Uncharacterized protein n=1 Tax=Trichonephila clavipes TaxID=2585209 RepID=A0A8X6W5X3_TRICX|nr:hypothetical protein TNCV_4720281 [Trichonephila clavipes]
MILATVSPIPRHLERAEADARFRLTTGHDFLGVYFHWLCHSGHLYCGHARMLQSTGLYEYPADDIVSWYWGGSASNGQEAKHGRWINK